MCKRIFIAGLGREGLELVPLLEANPELEVTAIVAEAPDAARAALRGLAPELAESLGRLIVTDLAAALATPGLVAVVDADASPVLRERLAALRGVPLLPPALARLLYAHGPGDGASKPDVLRALRELLGSEERMRDRRAVLQLVLQIAVAATGADRGSLMLFDAREGALRVEVALGIEEELLPKIRVQPGEGIAGRAFAAERPILLQGKADRSRFEIVRERDDVESAISVPLAYGGRVIGVLNLSHARNQGQFGSEDFAFVDELARLDAEIIGHAEQQHDLLRASQTQGAEAEVRRQLATPEPLARRLGAICTGLAASLAGGVCQIYLRDAESDSIVLQAASTPLDPLAVRERLRFGEGLAGRAAALARPLWLGGGPAHSGLCYAALPLVSGGVVLGVLTAQGQRGGGAEFEVERLRAAADVLAGQLASALSALRVEHESRSSRRMAELFTTLAGSADERELARRITGAALALLEAQEAVLRLRDGASGIYRIVSWSGVGDRRTAAMAELERGLASKALRARGLVRIGDLTVDPAFAQHAVGVDTAMSAPLARAGTDGSPVGCLSLLGKAPDDPLLGNRFVSFDERLLGELAQHALLALDGAPRRAPVDVDLVTSPAHDGALRERLAAELARARTDGNALALLLLWVDGLDGPRARAHLADGEGTVRALEAALRAAVRERDVVMRLEPSLFAFLVPEPSSDVVWILAALCRAAREALEGRVYAARDLGLRLGYATYPADGNDADALERAARGRRVEAL